MTAPDTPAFWMPQSDRERCVSTEAALTASRAEADALRGEVERLTAVLRRYEGQSAVAATCIECGGALSSNSDAVCPSCITAARAAQVPDGGK